MTNLECKSLESNIRKTLMGVIDQEHHVELGFE